LFAPALLPLADTYEVNYRRQFVAANHQLSSARACPATNETSEYARNASEHRQHDLGGICFTLGGPDRDVKKPKCRGEKDSRECPYDCEPYLVSYLLTWVTGDILSIFGRKVLEGSSSDVLLVGHRHALDCRIHDIPLNFVWKSFGCFSSDVLLELVRESLGRLSSDILLELVRESLDCVSKNCSSVLEG
jgi:hypothetical protein